MGRVSGLIMICNGEIYGLFVEAIQNRLDSSGMACFRLGSVNRLEQGLPCPYSSVWLCLNKFVLS